MFFCSIRPARSQWVTGWPREFIRRLVWSKRAVAEVAQLSSLADETPEGRSIVVLAKDKYDLSGAKPASQRSDIHPVLRQHADERRRFHRQGRKVVQVHPQRRRRCDKKIHVEARAALSRKTCDDAVKAIRSTAAARRWPCPTITAVIGVIHLKDIVKGGIKGKVQGTAEDRDTNGNDHRRQSTYCRRDRRPKPELMILSRRRLRNQKWSRIMQEQAADIWWP